MFGISPLPSDECQNVRPDPNTTLDGILMFSDLFFLFLTMLLITVGQDTTDLLQPENIPQTLMWSCLLYIGTLSIIWNQTKFLRWSKERIIFCTNLEFLTFLSILYFYLEIPLLFTTLFPLAAITLVLYFIALTTAHYSYNRLSGNQRQTGKSIGFLFPLSLPFLLLTLIIDIGNTPFTFICIAALAIFFPTVLIWCWGCPPLNNPELSQRLEKLCKKAHFKHAGFKVWSIMEHAYTAAIIGIVSRFRYVMFTKPLIDYLPPESVEAVLAHEIGHQKHGHLLWYPLILMGMVTTSILVASIEGPFAMSLILFIATAALYYRFIFGYFSRLFERQADLYIFTLQLNPDHLIDALNSLANFSGTSRRAPNWHHFSIQERIHFIEKVKHDTTLYARHQRRVKYSLGLYSLLLGAALLFLFIA